MKLHFKFLIGRLTCAALLLGLFLLTSLQAQEPTAVEDQIDFARQIDPILRRNCYRCHGSKNQEGGLQLNARKSAFAEADSGDAVIVPEDADASLLMQRVADHAYGDIMPLDGQPLTSKEIATLRRWIDSGAKWPDELAEPEHWAYRPVASPELPASDRSPVDWYIERELNQKVLQFSGRLDKPRLLRRVSLALTGLPPTPDEVDAFLHDDSEQAYERVVDRLLASKHYGERWAVPWMDMARYADSNGYQADQLRDNWAYRDWVIRAFNDDLPFDEFVSWQIAGDLFPNATVDQKIATGFHRMTTCNVEAGVHPEANRMQQVIDRVNTTATVFLGTTLECAQCHDHKYDPLTQKDYYQFLAYFNNTPLEVKNTSGVTWDFFGPTMDLPMDESKQSRYERVNDELTLLKADRVQVLADVSRNFDAWLASVRDSTASDTGWKVLTPVHFQTSGNETFEILPDGSVLLGGDVPDKVDHTFVFDPGDEPIVAIKVELLTDDSIPGKGPGRGDPKRSNVIISELTCEQRTQKESTKLKLVDATADFSQTGWDVANAIDGNRSTGWAFSPQFGKPHWARFTLAEPLRVNSGSEQLVVKLGQYFGRGRVAGRVRMSTYTGDVSLLNIDESDLKLARQEKLKPAQEKKLRASHQKSDARLLNIDREIKAAEQELKSVKPETTLVMVEMQTPRETFILDRGDYESPLEQVSAHAPEVFPEFNDVEKTADRRELAAWLTSPENPLLSRVTVNRWWAEFFGTGIVDTPEDFGTQASYPTHLELLDLLAAELIESGWSMKHVHKMIVMSDAFQRDSHTTQKLRSVDPDNRLLARGPRFRMSAELVRDNALAISGLLSDRMYGVPIMPHQPDNLWHSIGRNQPKWIAAEDEDRFRRGIYVIWKRAVPYPSFITFDAPDRGNCTVSRQRTNTPLQALTLLNDPAYAEMALAFADRILSESESADEESRLRYAIHVALARKAGNFEINLLKQLLNAERSVLADNAVMVSQRTTLQTKAIELQTTDKQELAAWFAVANAILNLDEVLNR